MIIIINIIINMQGDRKKRELPKEFEVSFD